MIEPEQYNELGEIIKIEKPITFERTMSAYDQHIIHKTKDLFESECSYCQDYSKRKTFYICSKCKEDCLTRAGLDDHWLLEH